ncbi:xylose isomerase [Mesorhizobium sp. WSM4312]|uniref:sugar phosphate isomerase/epimerase family protein n=1 Tax=unclassified Mesorhizobium TaxID=325217 RepID=UPI000BB04D0B|nr:MULTISPECIES: sugar phosphate isomerase/epimerase [unclassified Mesorhizobium]PBB65019.1 xylose isomerase [Mesorhizobium sp. WSM4312]PBC19649.1 xylose isomerase [Mesorhizobium sp. WSM4311]TRC98657.1 sugar phosphate isomerase/epimerase [Mesorhizobium sp. WSM4305]
MLQVGLNPYGLTYHLGLQARGTPRANPKPAGLEGFIALATELGAKVLEIWVPWLTELSDDAVIALRERLAGLGITPIVSGGLLVGEPLDDAFRAARLLKAKIIRTALTPVLCGDRNAAGEKWSEFAGIIRARLQEWGPRAIAEGHVLAIENHQDFTSQELADFCALGGEGVGITFDTGNTFPVGEAPLDFTRRIAPYVRHVHLKDYRVQFTTEGYRLIRCAIGDGAVPFAELFAVLAEHHDRMTAVLEPGALEARHVRFLSDDWWYGYPPKTAREFAACLRAAQRNRLPDDADYRTPWEREDDVSLVSYELDMIRRSAANMRNLGLMKVEKI